MGMTTKIQWCDHTFNPWRGCTKVAEGCRYCYAEAFAKRNPATLGVWGDSGTRVVASNAMWSQPGKWDREAAKSGERRRVFCASLADVFEDREELITPRARLFVRIDQTPNLDWLLVTKRPENIPKLWPWEVNAYRRNVWLMTSVATQADADRNIPLLKACRSLSPVLGVSAEPLIERIDFHSAGAFASPDGFVADAQHGPRHIDDGAATIDWLIVGGESGPHARPCDVAWVRRGIVAARDSQSPVAVFVKQLGKTCSMSRRDAVQPVAFGGGWHAAYPGADFGIVEFGDSKGGDPDEWPEDLRIREFPEVG